jgi:endonuclease
MSIYEKPVRLLLKDFVASQNITKGQIISREQVISWFRENYPKIKMGTISAHFLKMSVNAPSRIHCNANPNGDDDLFYQIDGGHFRLY